MTDTMDLTGSTEWTEGVPHCAHNEHTLRLMRSANALMALGLTVETIDRLVATSVPSPVGRYAPSVQVMGYPRAVSTVLTSAMLIASTQRGSSAVVTTTDVLVATDAVGQGLSWWRGSKVDANDRPEFSFADRAIVSQAGSATRSLSRFKVSQDSSQLAN